MDTPILLWIWVWDKKSKSDEDGDVDEDKKIINGDGMEMLNLKSYSNPIHCYPYSLFLHVLVNIS